MQTPEFKVIKTTDLTDNQIEEINSLFKEVFHKERTSQEFLNQSIQNPFGYSFHAVMLIDGVIKGLNSFVPSYYIVDGERKFFANSTDTMIEKPFRDFFNYKDITEAGFRALKQEGADFVYGYPNDVSYPIAIKGKLFKDIGRMRIYCLPLRIGGIKPKLSFLNIASRLFCHLYLFISGLLATEKIQELPVAKDSETFNLTRYLRNDADYSSISLKNGGTAYYKVMTFEGIRTAFLIDIEKKIAHFIL